jgi:NAD(P)-dependent dehydrogenase (short-subunit alcohol dehydrogenase family)
MRDFGLQDKVVVITGGGGALGSAFARGFADHGASLAILDFDLDNAKPTAARFPAEKVIKLNDKDINRARDLLKYRCFPTRFILFTAVHVNHGAANKAGCVRSQ